MGVLEAFVQAQTTSQPFSGWAWVQAAAANDAEPWAKFLVGSAFVDIAGFPAVLRSDQGQEFWHEVVKACVEMLGIEQVFGASYHP